VYVHGDRLVCPRAFQNAAEYLDSSRLVWIGHMQTLDGIRLPNGFLFSSYGYDMPTISYDELLFTCAGALRIRKEETAERKERLYWIAHMQPLPVKFEILTVI